VGAKLRVSGGNRVTTHDPDDGGSWGLVVGVPVRNGHGEVVATSTRTRSTFNYGQTRTFAGETHVLAVSTSNYGYVISATGTKRNGWMAYDALSVSSACP
jgi:hypothetical protein